MTRVLSLAVVAVLFLAGGASAADKAKNQMVKGTIKAVDPAKDLLVVNQKTKGGTAERQLSITKTTEFVVTIGDKTEKSLGREGLNLLVGQEGATVAVKCDKDVNVLSVTVTAKK